MHNLKVKGMFLYSAVTSSLDHSFHSSASNFSSPGRPVHSDTNLAYFGSILVMLQLRATTKSLTLTRDNNVSMFWWKVPKILGHFIKTITWWQIEFENISTIYFVTKHDQIVLKLQFTMFQSTFIDMKSIWSMFAIEEWTNSCSWKHFVILLGIYLPLSNKGTCYIIGLETNPPCTCLS